MNDEVNNMTTEEVMEYLNAHKVNEFNLLDVRQDWEYEESHLPGAKLIPLPELADRLDEIADNKPTLVYCASGGRSAAAANMLHGQGLKDISNMLGGIKQWKKEHAVGPQTLGTIYFPDNASPIEIITLAYAMEANVAIFYSEMAGSTKQELSNTYTQLTKLEKGHMAKIFNRARDLDPSIKIREDLAKRSSITTLEGGITAKAFLSENKEYLKTPRGALEAAMMFEAQALDLYMRCANKAESNTSIEFFQELAQEEKSHLKVLGKLMKRKIVEDP